MMLTCREVAEQADAYLDGETSVLDRLRIFIHLKACKGCSRFIKQMKTTRELISEATQDIEFDMPDSRLEEMFNRISDHNS